MESKSIRSPSVLSDLNVNIHDDVPKKTSPLSLSNSLKNSSNSSENEKEVDDVNDQENKPPGSVESTHSNSSSDGFVFKKPSSRVTMSNDDNTLNSIIDGLSHLKLGSTPVQDRRFNHWKWTTPLKSKTVQSRESSTSVGNSFFDTKPTQSAAHIPENIECIVNDASPNKSDKDTSNSHHEDECSEYYDCSDGEKISEEAHINEVISDHSHTANSSFHSVHEKEHAAESGNSTLTSVKSISVNEESLAEMNRTQGGDQAFILEKYLSEQDFKLEISLSDVSFNPVTDEIDFELGKRTSICTQTENSGTGSLFSFEQQKKSKLCLSEYKVVNDVNIQSDQRNKLNLFAEENEVQSEESLFNLLTDYFVQNETRTSFDAKPEDDIFTLGRISESAFLHINTIEEENALIQRLPRKSSQLQSNDMSLNQNNSSEAQIQNDQLQTTSTSQLSQTPEQINAEIRTINETDELKQLKSDHSNAGSEVADCSDDESASNENLIPSDNNANEKVKKEMAQTSVDDSSEIQSYFVSESNEVTNSEPITTIDEIFTEVDKTPKKVNETADHVPPDDIQNPHLEMENLNETVSDLSILTEISSDCVIDEKSDNFSNDLNETFNVSKFTEKDSTVIIQKELEKTEEKSEDISNVSQLNKTADLDIPIVIDNDSSLLNQNAPEDIRELSNLNEMTDMEVSRQIKENWEDDSKFYQQNKSINLNISIVDEKNSLEQIQDASIITEPPSDLSGIACMEIARTIEEKSEDISNFSQLNKTADVDIPIVIDNDSSLLNQNAPEVICELSNLNEMTDIEVSHQIKENWEGDSKFYQQNKSINLDISIVDEKNSLEQIQDASIITEPPSDLSRIACMEIARTIEEKSEDIADFNRLDKPTILEISSSIENYSSTSENALEVTQETCNLNKTIDIIQPVDENLKNVPDLHPQNTITNLETSTIMENDSTAQIQNTSLVIQTSSHANVTICEEVTRAIAEQHKDFSNFNQANSTTDLEISSITEGDSYVQIHSTPVIIQKIANLNETVCLDVTRTVEENSEQFSDFSEQNETYQLKKTMIRDISSEFIQEPITTDDISHLESASLKHDIDTTTKLKEIESCNIENETDIISQSNETVFTVMPTLGSKHVLEDSFNQCKSIADDLNSTTTCSSDQNAYASVTDLKMKLNEESAIELSHVTEQTFGEPETSDNSNSNSRDNTMIIQGSPPPHCNSPIQFDAHAVSIHDIASPIPPNSPTELSGKWRTQIDLSSIVDHLECFTGRDSPSNSSDEMDVTDPVDSNIAPEVLQMTKLPPGVNRSYSNLESIPEMNENEMNEQNSFEENVIKKRHESVSLEKYDTKTELKLDNIVDNVVDKTENVFDEQGIVDVMSSTVVKTSPSLPELETNLDEFPITAAPINSNDHVFKTPITKSSQQSEAINDSSFNADYRCTRTASAKSIHSSRHSLVSPRLSFYKNSPSVFSPFHTPNRQLRQGTPKASGDIPPSLLDMSIGCFEKYTANQIESSNFPGSDVNKTIDVDDEPQVEETKLLYLDEPSKKVNVKTQTHDTELSDLRAENAKLKEDFNGLMEIAIAVADRESELLRTIRALIHNETELKKALEQAEDNNRILNNRYEALKDCSNELLARRNAELDEAKEEIRSLLSKKNEYSKKSESSSE